MQRTPTLLITGLCAAPLLALAGFALSNLFMRPGAGGSDHSIASGYVGLLAGLAFALIGFAVVWVFGSRLIGDSPLRGVLVVDAMLLIAGILAWSRILAADPRLEYADGRGVLEIEARIPKTLLAGLPVDAAVSVSFTGGDDSSVPHPELARDEGTSIIVPWETTPLRVKRWTVSAFVNDRELPFELDLPQRPPRSTEWSAWIAPAAGVSADAPQGVTLRYRFRLVARGS